MNLNYVNVGATFKLQGTQARSADPNAFLIHIIRFVSGFRPDSYWGESYFAGERYSIYATWWCGNSAGSAGIVLGTPVGEDLPTHFRGRTFGMCTKCQDRYRRWLTHQINWIEQGAKHKTAVRA